MSATVFEFARQGANADPGCDRQADRRRIDHHRIALDHAGFLEAPDPLRRAWRGEADEPRQLGDAGARVGRQGGENAGVEGVKIGILISKALHRKSL